jgi:hypothetical protein
MNNKLTRHHIQDDGAIKTSYTENVHEVGFSLLHILILNGPMTLYFPAMTTYGTERDI